jgi:hypothetical protein
MFEGRRLQYAAIAIGVAIVSLLLFRALTGDQMTASDDAGRANANRHYDDYGGPYPRLGPCYPANGVAQRNLSGCDPHYYERRDIYQQRAMARAARWQLILTAVSIGLLLFTLRLSIRATNAAIDQAQTARREFEELERPYLFADIPERPRHALAPPPLPTDPIVYIYRNHGRSPAVITRMWEERQRVRTSQRLPEPIDPMGPKGIRTPHGVVAAPDGGETQTFTLRTFPSQSQPPKSDDDTELWYFIGYAIYQDPAGVSQYVKGFCCHYVGGGEWRLTGSGLQPDPYNYDRKIERERQAPTLMQRVASAWAALTG